MRQSRVEALILERADDDLAQCWIVLDDEDQRALCDTTSDYTRISFASFSASRTTI